MADPTAQPRGRQRAPRVSLLHTDAIFVAAKLEDWYMEKAFEDKQKCPACRAWAELPKGDKYVPPHEVKEHIEKCRRALAEGAWTPTRQADREIWRPGEKQLHPLVQGALNRSMFKVPTPQWAKEVEIPGHYSLTGGRGRGAIIDLLVWAHPKNFGKAAPGFHAFEVKMADDKDHVRLDRQMNAYLHAAHFTWLVVVGADPAYADERVGLVRYDHLGDGFTVLRKPAKIPKPTYAPWLSSYFSRQAALILDRIPGASKEAAPAEDVDPDLEADPLQGVDLAG